MDGWELRVGTDSEGQLSFSASAYSEDTGPFEGSAPKHVQDAIEQGESVLRDLVESGILGEGPYMGGASGRCSEEHDGVAEVGANDTFTVTLTSQRRTQETPGDQSREDLLAEIDRLRRQVEEMSE